MTSEKPVRARGSRARMNSTAMARTQRIVATKRASSDSEGDLAFVEGISSFLALGGMPAHEADPSSQSRPQYTPAAQRNLLPIHHLRDIACDSLGGTRTPKSLKGGHEAFRSLRIC